MASGLRTKDTWPPFLIGRFVSTKREDPVMDFMDQTSDWIRISRKASAAVAKILEKRDGSRPGEILGSKKIAKLIDRKSSHCFFKTMLEPECLPICTVREKLLEIIRDNSIVIIVEDTDSGNMTQLTQYLHEDGYGSSSGMVGCTPGRVAPLVACQYVKFMSEEELLHETLGDPNLYQYRIIIMDGANTRSIYTEVLYGLLKKVVMHRRDFKLILTSITRKAARCSEFFGWAPIFEIPGSNFFVKICNKESPREDYINAAVKQTLGIHLSSPVGEDILMFMPCEDAVEATCYELEEQLNKLVSKPNKEEMVIHKLSIIPVFPGMQANLKAVFKKIEVGHRKCIVATDFLESSVSIDGILHVIDTGMKKLNLYNRRLGMDTLQMYPISQDSANRRAKHAGRMGICYRLYAKSVYQEMVPDTTLDIKKSTLDKVILLLLKSTKSVEELLKLEFLNPPFQEKLVASLTDLWVMGAVDDSGCLTELGLKMTEFPLDLRLVKMILMGEKLGCLEEIYTIVSMLLASSFFDLSKCLVRDKKFIIHDSDFLTLLNIFKQWEAEEFNAQWCLNNCLLVNELKTAKGLKSWLVDIGTTLNMTSSTCGVNWEPVRKTICSGFLQNAAWREINRSTGPLQYVDLKTGLSFLLQGSNCSEGCIVYHEAILTEKNEFIAQGATAVEAEWLAELAPMYFSIPSKKRHLSFDGFVAEKSSRRMTI